MLHNMLLISKKKPLEICFATIFNRHFPPSLGRGYDYRTHDYNTIASILKMWLRDLPEPLVPYALYDQVLDLYGTSVVISNFSLLLFSLLFFFFLSFFETENTYICMV